MIRLQNCNLIGPCKAGVSSLSLNNHYLIIVMSCACATHLQLEVSAKERATFTGVLQMLKLYHKIIMPKTLKT